MKITEKCRLNLLDFQALQKLDTWVRSNNNEVRCYGITIRHYKYQVDLWWQGDKESFDSGISLLDAISQALGYIEDGYKRKVV